MAIYHLTVGLISRKSGRSSTAAAAYRAGELVIDARTGAEHDYRRKRGVDGAQIVMPTGCDWQPSRSELWNAVERKNKRADAQLAREFEVALPAEMHAAARKDLALAFARLISDRYQVAADVAIHRPSRAGDERNHHAHILTTTNAVDGNGNLGNKVRELDAVAHDRNGAGRDKPKHVEVLRAEWASLVNDRLQQLGLNGRIDHRTLAAQREVAIEKGELERASALDRFPTKHLGPAATAIERGELTSAASAPLPERWLRPPRQSDIGRANRQIQLANELGLAERTRSVTQRSIIDLETSLAAALAERDAEFDEFLVGCRELAGTKFTNLRPSHQDRLGGSAAQLQSAPIKPDRFKTLVEGTAAQLAALRSTIEADKSNGPDNTEPETPQLLDSVDHNDAKDEGCEPTDGDDLDFDF